MYANALTTIFLQVTSALSHNIAGNARRNLNDDRYSPPMMSEPNVETGVVSR